TAMRYGTGYPIGPLAWADRIGINHVVTVLQHLHRFYGEDRYRVSPLLMRKFHAGRDFYD
nr:3-hydroxyacyl-CoA dehydrogenase family protein [Arenicellales bacterium]